MIDVGPFLFIRYRLSGGWSFFVGPLGVHWNPNAKPKLGWTR